MAQVLDNENQRDDVVQTGKAAREIYMLIEGTISDSEKKRILQKIQTILDDLILEIIHAIFDAEEEAIEEEAWTKQK